MPRDGITNGMRVAVLATVAFWAAPGHADWRKTGMRVGDYRKDAQSDLRANRPNDPRLYQDRRPSGDHARRCVPPRRHAAAGRLGAGLPDRDSFTNGPPRHLTYAEARSTDGKAAQKIVPPRPRIP